MAASTTGSVVSTKRPVVTMTQWARINAKAWLEGTYVTSKDGKEKFVPGGYQKLLEKDPLKALNQVREDFGIRDEAKHFDIDDPTYGGGADESGSEPKFDDLTPDQLVTVIEKGTLPDGKTAKMIPTEWISYPPLYTQSREHPDDYGSTLSLLQWARIMAYLFRFKKVDVRFPALKHHFEKDPAAAVEVIVHGGRVKGEKEEFDIRGLKDEFSTDIPYKYGETALFRLGNPPDPKLNLVNLQDVLTNSNGYARVLVRLCC